MKKHGKKKHQGITEQQDGGQPEVEVMGGLRPAKYGIKAWKPRGTRDVTKNYLHVDKNDHILINVHKPILYLRFSHVAINISLVM